MNPRKEQDRKLRELNQQRSNLESELQRAQRLRDSEMLNDVAKQKSVQVRRTW